LRSERYFLLGTVLALRPAPKKAAARLVPARMTSRDVALEC
jgi:hypothetical protein